MTSLDVTLAAASAYRVLVGDNRRTLRELPDRSVHMVATSPPYWGLRDYGHADQIGLEQSPEQYVATLVEVFREVRRVLRDDGTLWLNLGDSYFGGGYSNHDINGESWKERMNGDKRSSRQQDIKRNNPGIKPKDLVGIPWRVAFALQADGWYLRQDIIWAKPNPMPESVQGRCTKSHEYVFLLTKSARYFYDNEAMKEVGMGREVFGNVRAKGDCEQRKDNERRDMTPTPARNRRSVWQIATAPCKEAHFATWPPKLVEPMILAGTSERGCCANCGAQWVRIIHDTGKRIQQHRKPASQSAIYKPDGHAKTPSANSVLDTGFSRILETAGWRPSCNCGGEPVPCVVLDPFGGSGTTAGVANALGRKAILCELNPAYAEIVPRRVEAVVAAMRRKPKQKKKRQKSSNAQLNLFTA